MTLRHFAQVNKNYTFLNTIQRLSYLFRICIDLLSEIEI
jgi:hypothetical protein